MGDACAHLTGTYDAYLGDRNGHFAGMIQLNHA